MLPTSSRGGAAAGESRGDVFQFVGGDGDAVAVVEHDPRDPLAVDKCSIAAVEVFQRDPAGVAVDGRVPAADGLVGDDDIVVRMPADRRPADAELDLLHYLRIARYDQFRHCCLHLAGKR